MTWEELGTDSRWKRVHMGDDHRPGSGNPVHRVLLTIAGFALLVVGAALLVLPGPGLLLVLGGLVLLANEYPWARRLTGPVRTKAWQAAEQSVASPLRIAGSALGGLGLIGAGVAWIVIPSLPLGGVATGSSLILSGVVVLALLVFTVRRLKSSDGSAGVGGHSAATGDAPGSGTGGHRAPAPRRGSGQGSAAVKGSVPVKANAFVKGSASVTGRASVNGGAPRRRRRRPAR